MKFILWPGFFIRSGFRIDAYKRYEQLRELQKIQGCPPREEWFSSLLYHWVNLRFFLKTWKKADWLSDAYADLCFDEIWEFTKVKRVGEVRLTGDMVQVRDGGYEFTVNENGPGEL